MNYETIILTEEKFSELSKYIFSPLEYKNDSELEVYSEETNRIQDLIRENLRKKWTEEEDWEVGYDWNPYKTIYNCGGIYSQNIFCKQYVRTIMESIKLAKDPTNTFYHTVCEIVINPNGKTIGDMMEDWGEFYITEGKLYIHESMSTENINKLK